MEYRKYVTRVPETFVVIFLVGVHKPGGIDLIIQHCYNGNSRIMRYRVIS